MRTKTIVHRSAVPLYAAAAVWLVYALLFPLYQVRHFLLAAAVSGSGIGTALISACVYG